MGAFLQLELSLPKIGSSDVESGNPKKAAMKIEIRSRLKKPWAILCGLFSDLKKARDLILMNPAEIEAQIEANPEYVEAAASGRISNRKRTLITNGYGSTPSIRTRDQNWSSRNSTTRRTK